MARLAHWVCGVMGRNVSEGTAGAIQALAGNRHLRIAGLSGQVCGGSLIVSSDPEGGRCDDRRE